MTTAARLPSDVRDISDIANLDEAKATLLQGGPAAGQQGQEGGDAPAPAPAPKAKAKASPLSSGAGGARRGNIPPPAAAALAAANRRGAAEDGQGWDQDWDRVRTTKKRKPKELGGWVSFWEDMGWETLIYSLPYPCPETWC